jgi:hypothetical protein
MSTLDQFVLTCKADPAATVKLKVFLAAFRAFAGEEAHRWPQSRVLLALAGKYQIGKVRNALCIAGLALPTTRWEARNGSLVLL